MDQIPFVRVQPIRMLQRLAPSLKRKYFIGYFARKKNIIQPFIKAYFN